MEGVLARIKKKQLGLKKRSKKEVNSRPKISLDHYSALPLQEDEQEDNDEDDLGDLEDSDQDLDEDEDQAALAHSQTAPPLWVLPLYSLLPSHRQQKVFAPPPEGSR